MNAESREVLKGLSVPRWIYALNDRGKKRGSEKRGRVDVRGARSMRANKIPRKYLTIFFRWTLLSLLVRYVLIIFQNATLGSQIYESKKCMFFSISILY